MPQLRHAPTWWTRCGPAYLSAAWEGFSGPAALVRAADSYSSKQPEGASSIAVPNARTSKQSTTTTPDRKKHRKDVNREYLPPKEQQSMGHGLHVSFAAHP